MPPGSQLRVFRNRDQTSKAGMVAGMAEEWRSVESQDLGDQRCVLIHFRHLAASGAAASSPCQQVIFPKTGLVVKFWTADLSG